ncbi:DNA adenine methylase [Leucobacter zeae]|nr:DNA adenine methylase [Leucobacter zeae]
MVQRARRARRLRGPLTLIEPFAGGAATSLRLLTDGIVEHAFIADGDPMVASFWREAAMRPSALIQAMRAEYRNYVSIGGATAVARWDHWRQLDVPTGKLDESAQHQLAMKCLFLNRTTFSGILHGSAGPIGGRAQKEGGYSISCRFNPDALAERIQWIGHLYATGKLLEPKCQDWRQSLIDFASAGSVRDGVIAYLDPPYVAKSTKLYRKSFKAEALDRWGDMTEHLNLAAYLRQSTPFRWILSYDYNPELTTDVMLYRSGTVTPTEATAALGAGRYRMVKGLIELQHTASVSNRRRPVQELVISTLSESDTAGLITPLPQ